MKTNYIPYLKVMTPIYHCFLFLLQTNRAIGFQNGVGRFPDSGVDIIEYLMKQA